MFVKITDGILSQGEENTLEVSTTTFSDATSASSAPEAYGSGNAGRAQLDVNTSDCVSARVTTQRQHHISRWLNQCFMVGGLILGHVCI